MADAVAASPDLLSEWSARTAAMKPEFAVPRAG